MSDCVRRESVKEWLKRWDGYIDKDIIARMQDRVVDIPSADVRENVRGEWEIETGEEWDGGGAYVCSACHYGYSFGSFFEANTFNFCPNCGSDMRGEKDDSQ